MPDQGAGLWMVVGSTLCLIGIVVVLSLHAGLGGGAIIASGVLTIFGGRIGEAIRDADKVRIQSQLARFPERVFEKIRKDRQALAMHAREIKDVLAAEATETGSSRAEHRQELLRGALVNREAQIRLLDADIWTRDVQLWLNQLEGFLAAKLPKLRKQNAATLCDTFTALVESGKALQARSSELALDGIMPQRALRVLQDCLAAAPELGDRVKDARALAVVGEGAELDPNFAPGGSWLHWLQEAIPTIELLPSEFSEDAEYLRVQTELRLLRDGVKYADSGSLDLATDSSDRTPKGRWLE